jgi:hypothetical protein
MHDGDSEGSSGKSHSCSILSIVRQEKDVSLIFALAKLARLAVSNQKFLVNQIRNRK